ncbi:Helix-turn-helix [Micromonospora chokoriensis]|uniref:Helix-turn-helix n=1 Tax=Micromonospora chokoriensis TaxID=356851 RepID=A0A1C4XLR6_9ACTN|nr:Helix-turn-helix [Micromonospora chokoriensis]
MADLPHPLTAFIVGEIRRARGPAGMTQESFGRGAGFSASQVSAVESETRALTMDVIKGADRAFKNGGLFERMVAKLGAPSWYSVVTVSSQAPLKPKPALLASPIRLIQSTASPAISWWIGSAFGGKKYCRPPISCASTNTCGG